MRHTGKVGGDDASVDVLAQRDCKFALRLREALALHYVAQPDGLAFAVRHLDADGALAGHTLDQDRLGRHRETEIVGKPGDAGDLDAGFGLELKRGDNRPGIDLRDLSIDVEFSTLLHQDAGLFAQSLLALNRLFFFAIKQRVHRYLV